MEAGETIVGALVLAAGAWETYALVNNRPGDTFSEVTRRAFRIKSSKTGRAVFATGWLAFAGWFWGHILYEWPFPGF